jgi:hypothetical protein
MNLSRTYLFECLLCLVLASSAVAHAEVALPFEVPEATVEYQRPLTRHGIVLPLSAPKRISNEVRFEKVERMVDGSGHEYLLRLDNLVSNRAAHDFFVNTFRSAGELLFTCQQRACETSSDWANDFFREPRLYGRDNEQYYLAARFIKDGKMYHVGIYSVLNGRRQAFSYIRVFESASPEQVVLLTGRAFTMQEFENRDLSSIREELSAKPKASLWLVAYGTLSDEAISVQMDEQSRALIQLKEILINKHGIAGDRIQTHLAGPFHEPDSALPAAQWFRMFVIR